jgi:acyl carrier protein
LTDGLELTSLELVRLLVSLEEHLDIEIDDAEVMNANFQTVDDIVSLVSRSLAPSGHAGR